MIFKKNFLFLPQVRLKLCRSQPPPSISASGSTRQPENKSFLFLLCFLPSLPSTDFLSPSIDFLSSSEIRSVFSSLIDSSEKRRSKIFAYSRFVCVPLWTSAFTVSGSVGKTSLPGVIIGAGGTGGGTFLPFLLVDGTVCFFWSSLSSSASSPSFSPGALVFLNVLSG